MDNLCNSDDHVVAWHGEFLYNWWIYPFAATHSDCSGLDQGHPRTDTRIGQLFPTTLSLVL